MSLLLDRSFRAASLSHLAVDLLNAQRPVLLAILSAPLGLTNALIGLISMIYTFAASLSQPVFGVLSDRYGARRIAAAGSLWMGLMFALAVLAPGRWSLVLLTLAALGSGAFHPAGTAEATEAGQLRFHGREATAASVFFLFGQAGYSLGPALGGALVDRWGPAGLVLLTPLVLPMGLTTGRDFGPASIHAAAPTQTAAPRVDPGPAALAALIAVSALRSWAQTNMVTFLPKYYADHFFSATELGIVAALFMAGSALGGVAGGWLGDRCDRRMVTATTLALGAIPLALFRPLGLTPYAYLLSALSGALTGASQSILIVFAQRLMPGRLGVASGLALGFTFAAGSLGTWLTGYQADLAGFDAVFLTTACLSLLAAGASVGLKLD